MLWVTSILALPPIAAARIGTSFGIRKLVGPIAIVPSRALGLDRNRAEELLEERARFRELGRQVPSNLRDGGLREHQTRETDPSRSVFVLDGGVPFRRRAAAQGARGD
jgi:hypothetical protein